MAPYKGIHLTFHKKPAALLPTAELTDVAQVVLPFAYPTSAPVSPSVFLYDTVRRGSLLSEVQGEPFSAVRSSVTGVVSGEKTVNHPLYGELPCAVIDCLSDTAEPVAVPENHVITAETILEAAESAGIIDELDGVPLMLKLREWQETPTHFVVADGVEVQPYSSSAWATLRSYAEEVLDGLSLAAACAGTNGYHIAACLSPSRRRSLSLRVGKHRFFAADSRYPIKEPVRRGRKNGEVFVPKNAVVRRIGVQACLALSRAVRLGEAQTTAILTVSGDAVKRPQNLQVPFGTSVQELLRRCGLSCDPEYLILGDIMTGVASLTQDVPVLPGMTCVLAFAHRPTKLESPRACIGCGRCVRSCHAGLLPFEIYRRFENMHDEQLATLSAHRCDGCGACSYVCPCNLELTATVLEAARTDNTILLNLKEDPDA
ncbi:MAG: 4Fe-4S dicluster domain-containing protein [Clostridia bacterium]|nr:4Fe-4S dicluster domain-containing protein [Clostridia bacterium]